MALNSRESLEQRFEVPSTSSTIVGLEMFSLLAVVPQHCLKTQHLVGIGERSPHGLGGTSSNSPGRNLD